MSASDYIDVAQKNLELAAVEPDEGRRKAYLETAAEALRRADSKLKQQLTLHIHQTIVQSGDLTAAELAARIREIVGQDTRRQQILS